MLNAGTLDRRIAIQQRTGTTTPTGAPKDTWAAYATVWAQVLPLTGREYYSQQANQEVSTKTARFRIRWLAALAQETQGFRIVYSGQTYDIRNVAEIGRREGLEIVGEVITQ